MTRSQICVKPPDGQWKADVTTEFSDTTFCLPSMTVGGRGVIEVVYVAGDTAEACLTTVQNHPAVDEFALVHRTPTEATARLTTETACLLTAANRSGTPLVSPIEIHDGEIMVDVISTHDDISGLGTELERTDATFDVMYVQRDHDLCPVLTERQQEVLRAALNYGYYETPRRCSLTELADELGVAKSTCSGTLHRAETALVKYFLTGHATADGTATADEFTRREIEI